MTIQNDSAVFSRHANISTRDSGLGGIYSDSVDQALAAINERFARSPLVAEDVYLFPGVLSSQHIDSYGTRMAASSLRNYRNEIMGSGYALMNSHRLGGWMTSGELPLGQIFGARLVGRPLGKQTPFSDDGGQELRILSYVQRGIQITDVATDDLIAAIDGGTIRQMSITFSAYPNGRFTCSICGGNYSDYGDCRHFVFQHYTVNEGADDEHEARCFAWVENATGYEGSLVYAGANPGAVLLNKLRAGADAGDLTPAAIQSYEHRFRTPLRDRFATGTQVPQSESRATPAKHNQPEETGNLGARQPGNTSQEENQRMEKQRLMLAALLTLANGLGLDTSEIGDDPTPEALQTLQTAGQLEIRSLTAKAADGDKYRRDLIDEAVAARTKVQGDGFMAQEYRDALQGATLEFVRGEINAWGNQARSMFTTEADSRSADDENDGDPTPATDTRPAAASGVYG